MSKACAWLVCHAWLGGVCPRGLARRERHRWPGSIEQVAAGLLRQKPDTLRSALRSFEALNSIFLEEDQRVSNSKHCS